jgi:thiosulfate dehydrogenase
MNEQEKKEEESPLVQVISKLIGLIIFLLFVILGLIYVAVFGFPKIITEHVPPPSGSPVSKSESATNSFWQAPDTSSLAMNKDREQILYGRALIANTALYLGPSGSVAHLGNGMNCQNCHLDAGTKPFGNNYSATASTYPKFRERSGKTEDLNKRINDCFERSLNGKGLDTMSKEMQAMKAYIIWLGKDVKKGEKPKGAGIEDLAYLDRAADPMQGKKSFMTKCISCHGEDGQGKPSTDGKTYIYPPLWGIHSYNTGAGLYRITRLAGYIKNNMPLGASIESPQITNEEAWDIAAFLNSQERPTGMIEKDWPDIRNKPVDQPFGPYAETYSETQHKYGPFGPIAEAKKKTKKKSA